MFVASLAVVGCVLFADAVRHLDVDAIHERWLALALFTVLVIATEVRPITIVRAGGVDQIVASTTFSFAVFLAFGPAMAMLAQVLASLVGDLAERKPFTRTVFNISQYLVGWGSAGIVYHLVLGSTATASADTVLTVRWTAATVVAALTYFVVNKSLVGAVVALSTSSRVRAGIRETVLSEAGSDLLLLALAPAVLVVADRSLLILPLLLLPVFAVYRSAAISAEKEHQALYDSLTDLPNRLSFMSMLEARIARRDAASSPAAVLLIDLDRFKEVNDTLGHLAGDELLRHIGPRLAAALPASASIARIGGDEFAVLLPDAAGDLEAIAAAVAIGDSLVEPFRIGDFNLEVDASVGIAMFPSHGTTSEVLLKHADVAMYVAKGCNGRVELYDPEQDRHSTRRLGLLSELRTALGDGQVVLYYQPKLDLRTGVVHEVEALVRWIHPEHGLIPPSEFVPMAEHTGLIRPLTSHVLRLAVAQARLWRDNGFDLAVSVNLSARSLHDSSIAEEVQKCLTQAGLPSTALHLEITESSIMADPARAKRVLEELHRAGLHMSIDDFGTGYSSLAYLQDLPVGEIKIDRSFVMNLLDNDADQVIVRSTIELARNLGLTSTAEGVESQDVLDWLIDARCDHAQGYHIARPMASDAVAPWMAARHALGVRHVAQRYETSSGLEAGNDSREHVEVLARVVQLFPPAHTRRRVQ